MLLGFFSFLLSYPPRIFFDLFSFHSSVTQKMFLFTTFTLPSSNFYCVDIIYSLSANPCYQFIFFDPPLYFINVIPLYFLHFLLSSNISFLSLVSYLSAQIFYPFSYFDQTILFHKNNQFYFIQFNPSSIFSSVSLVPFFAPTKVRHFFLFRSQSFIP